MKTAVEWLVEQFETTEFMFHDRSSIINKAKEMEKEQIINSFDEAIFLTGEYELTNGEQYYNETFKSVEQ
jgi:hypothetical protein